MAKYVSFEKVMDAADLHEAKLQRIWGKCRIFRKRNRFFCMELYRGRVPIEFFERFVEWLEDEE